MKIKVFYCGNIQNLLYLEQQQTEYKISSYLF